MVGTVISSVVLVVGLLFIIVRPIWRLTRSPLYWDMGIGTGAVIIFLIYIMTAVVTPKMIEEDLAKEPCGSRSPQGACYKLEPDLCKTIWDKAIGDCKQELADVIKARPTGLIWPALSRCSARKMDKSVRFNRVQSETDYCKAYFSYLEEKH
ncbi:hypothetical protein [Bdellovibrio sp. HCB-162]|uniref:hypothetical protein n=1 Tax=Bdellovibrio sp. HCB-162 TaxID=3394234 RepID=UPI0039BD64FE